MKENEKKEPEKKTIENYEIEKNEMPYERVLFFSDAVVAIAITLLALELRLDIPAEHKLQFADLIQPWHKYLAFILSFINIAGFWNTHHRLFMYIKKMDERLKWYNMSWLFFIVTLPFATSVLSDHLADNAAVFLYALNIFMISAFQNFLWDYSVWDKTTSAANREWKKNSFIDPESIDEEQQKRFRVIFNLDMLNGLISIAVSFFAPVVAFILLFFKIPLMLYGYFYIASIRRKELGKEPIGRNRRRGKAQEEEEE